MKFLNLGCPQKLYRARKILSYSRFLRNFRSDIIKQNTRSILFSNRKYKGRKKLATKEEMKKKIVSANINSREAPKIEYFAKLSPNVNYCEN